MRFGVSSKLAQRRSILNGVMAGQIPQSFINDILGHLDIVGVIGERVPLKKAGKDYQARCPFHDEKTPSFTVSQDKQFYYCFGCSASGTSLTFLVEYERLPFVEAVETLAAQVGVEVPRERFGRPQRDNSGLYDIMLCAQRYFRGQLRGSKLAADYLKSRGLTGTIARDFGIGFAPDSWDGLQRAACLRRWRQQDAARGGPCQQERAGQRLRPFPRPYPVSDSGHLGPRHRCRRPIARGHIACFRFRTRAERDAEGC